jgi:hypothetical protein
VPEIDTSARIISATVRFRLNRHRVPRCNSTDAPAAASWPPVPRSLPAMQFLLLIYIDDGLLQALPSEDYDRLMHDCLRHADALQADGTLVLAQKLEPVHSARTLRTRQGKERITDGPFAETHELLAGFNLINARDHDDALRIARQFPWSRFGSIEVRPLADMDAERERVGA